MLRCRCYLALVLGLTWAPAAWAQAQPVPPAAPPAVDAPAPAAAASSPAAPPDAPETRQSWRKRSRFFSSAQLGAGYFHASSGAPDDTRTFSGGSVSWELAIGGRISPHLALAGAFLRDEIIGLSSKD